MLPPSLLFSAQRQALAANVGEILAYNCLRAGVPLAACCIGTNVVAKRQSCKNAGDAFEQKGAAVERVSQHFWQICHCNCLLNHLFCPPPQMESERCRNCFLGARDGRSSITTFDKVRAGASRFSASKNLLFTMWPLHKICNIAAQLPQQPGFILGRREGISRRDLRNLTSWQLARVTHVALLLHLFCHFSAFSF